MYVHTQYKEVSEEYVNLQIQFFADAHYLQFAA